jgi:uncharacterized protein (TIGR03067 family)
MRLLTFLSVSMLTFAPFATAAPPDRPVEGDLAKLQGAWTTKAGPNKDIPVLLEIKEDRVTVRLKVPLQGLEIRAEGTVRVDESVTPHALDWTGFTALDGQDMPEVLAIYEFKGETFRICNGGPNSDRPTEFKPGENSLADVLEFRRAPASK